MRMTSIAPSLFRTHMFQKRRARSIQSICTVNDRRGGMRDGVNNLHSQELTLIQLLNIKNQFESRTLQAALLRETPALSHEQNLRTQQQPTVDPDQNKHDQSWWGQVVNSFQDNTLAFNYRIIRLQIANKAYNLRWQAVVEMKISASVFQKSYLWLYTVYTDSTSVLVAMGKLHVIITESGTGMGLLFLESEWVQCSKQEKGER